LNQGLIAAERVQALCPAGQHDQPPSSSGATWPDRCDLSIRSLRFAWAPHQPELFGDLSFDLGEGQRLAVTGTSGCGKTSLLRLILGQIKPQDGRITVGGIDIASMDRATRYRNIAYLPQNPVLFRDTVAGNLRLVRDSASEEDLVKALNQAGLGNWLEALPNGLHTWLDEGADNLSGGERRRLAVAQLFLTDARLVLLDEPSASLDDRTLDDLNKSLDRWLVGRTTIVVTHREDALIPVDRKLSLEPAVDVRR
jgi:ABC-type transport system involved in cytochrome bd biosynthesis fused ATPase/permease subunit